MSSSIRSDFHLHSNFSADSDTPMEEMVRRGIEEHLSVMCFTEHLDRDYPAKYGLTFDLDLPAYRDMLFSLREKYADLIDLRFGIELGLQPHLADWHGELLSGYPFDFVIGSSHVVRDIDPYEDEFYEGRSEADAYQEYFEEISRNLDAFSGMDVYGHIDYVVRYGPNKNRFYSYQRYSDILDEILKKIVDRGIGIECNTGGIKYGLGHPNPCEDVLRRYRELGGEVVTIGSDAHRPAHVAYAFGQIPEILKSCGFRYYAIFKDRRPEFIKL